jgi:predicted AAA+ superfamily ATPase
MITRAFNLLKDNSFFLFGARGTGKTTLLNDSFSATEAIRIDLLDPSIHAKLEANPASMQEMIQAAILDKRWVIIDEIQKVPALLDLVHLMIERDKIRFALTGSSARKLRRGAANLLAGRAFVFKLYPLLANELAENFVLEDAMAWGTLPTIWNTNNLQSRSLYLQSYAETYLREEIVAEQVVRKLAPFRRFLNVAAQMSGKIINYSKIASDCATDASNVRNYFQILDDTLLGFFLEPFHQSVRKRQSQSPKFYFIDTGISRALAGQLDLPLRVSTSLYGETFEALVISQIRAHLEYSLSQYQISYLKTKDGAEIDLIIERAGCQTLLIEIKSSTSIRREDLNNLNRFANDMTSCKALCFYNGNTELLVGRVHCMHWLQGLALILSKS